MSRRQLFLRLLLKAAWVKKGRTLTAVLSVLVAALIATVSLTIYSGLGARLGSEFRAFGANAVLTSGSPLTAAELERLRSVVADGATIVPVGYAIAHAGSGQAIVVGGADLDVLQKLNSWWDLKPAGNGNALLGARAATLLGSGGASLKLFYSGKALDVTPRAVFTSGSDDDSRIYLSQPDFFQLTGAAPNSALLRLEGTPAQVQQQIARLSALPGIHASPLRQVTAAQSAIAGRTHSVVIASSVIVIVLIGLCMVVTFTSSVLERRRDFAVMKALGASNRTVTWLFTAESSLLAVAGALPGFFAGSLIAVWIGHANFGAAVPWRPALLLPVVLGALLLTWIASSAPLRVLQRIQPAGILRGE